MMLTPRLSHFSSSKPDDKKPSEPGGYTAAVQAAAKGDAEAFTELVTSFQGMAGTVARRWFDDRGLVEDAVQEAFLKVYLELPKLRDADAFPAWFKRILHSCCSRIKSRQPLWLIDNWQALNTLPDPAADPCHQIESYLDQDIIADTLNTLDGVAREASIQRYVLGLSYKAIAISLQVPEGTIKRRLHSAKSIIFRTLQSQNEPVIRIGYLPITDHLLGMISHCINRGPLHIWLKKYLSWASLAESLENGLLDAAFVMAPLAMALHNKGVPLAYILDAHQDGSALTVRQDIKLDQSWTDVRVGLPYSISTQGILLADMIGNQRQTWPNCLLARYQGPSYLLNSLDRGEIDAFFCAEPWNTKAVMEGRGNIFLRSKDLRPGHICCILVVRKPYLQKHGELVRSYLRLLLAASEYLSTNLSYCAKIQELYTGVAAAVNEHVLTHGTISFNDLSPDRNRLDSLMNLAIKTGILDRPCNLDAFLCTDIL